MTKPDGNERPEPQAPGYGDQGPAGAGREGSEQDEAAKPQEKSGGPEPR